MCGIVAVVSKWKTSGFMTSQQKIFDQLLLCDMLRGKDATGVIAVMKDGDFSIMKEATDAYLFQQTYQGSPVDKEAYAKGIALIGHNRAKTIGENLDVNAHPFVEDKTFAMVHNGTLRNHKGLHDTDVDSHALTIVFKQAMDSEDWKAGMEEALSKVSGAFACIWYDQKRHQVCVIRNSERPMAMLVTQSSIIFASEGPLAQWICQRNNEKVEKAEILDTNTLYTIDMSKSGGDVSKTFLLSKPPVHTGYTNGTDTAKTTSTDTKATATDDKGDTGATGDGDVGAIGSARALLSKNAFKKLRSTLWARTLDFWVADYVDMINNHSGECLTALIMGESLNGAFDLCEVNHEIRANVELKKMGLKEADFYGNVRMKGKVYDVEYDKENSRAIVRVDVVSVEEISGVYTH